MNITKDVEQYINSHASVKDILKKGLVNYSALSRQIIKETGLKRTDFDAVLIACRRTARKLSMKSSAETRILQILQKSKMEIKTKILAVVLDKDVDDEDLLDFERKVKKKKDVYQMIEGTSAITLITNDEYSDEINRLFRKSILKMNRNLVDIILKSPEKLENVPGVSSYLYSLFAEREINILETMSCYTDTLLVVNEEDLNEVIRIMKF
jgi:hypothetical protein